MGGASSRPVAPEDDDDGFGGGASHAGGGPGLGPLYTEQLVMGSFMTHAVVNQYLSVKEVGRGAHGAVQLVVDTNDGRLYAMKIVNKRRARARGVISKKSRRRSNIVSEASAGSMSLIQEDPSLPGQLSARPSGLVSGPSATGGAKPPARRIMFAEPDDAALAASAARALGAASSASLSAASGASFSGVSFSGGSMYDMEDGSVELMREIQILSMVDGRHAVRVHEVIQARARARAPG